MWTSHCIQPISSPVERALEAGHRVAGMLTSIHDPAQLEDVGDWIIDCEDGDELLAPIG